MAFNCVAITVIRSLSFTRNSSASLITVVPDANIAATAKIGTSSINLGIIAPSNVMPRNWLDRTRRSATGSPVTSRSFKISISAPIICNASRTPVRVGFMPTFSIVKSEPGTIAPATNQNAAELISPGTITVCPINFAPPTTVALMRSGSTFTVAPNARSIRSLWSRDRAGSVTVVSPSTIKPANRMQDLT